MKNKIKEQAEKYYRDGDFYCSESIIKSIIENLELGDSEDAVRMASGFPVGIGGSGCMCGAVSGGVMAIGYVFGRSLAKDESVNKAMKLSAELHEYFKGKNKTLCCRILTKGMELGSDVHMEQCIRFTGEVAEKTAEIIMREMDV